MSNLNLGCRELKFNTKCKILFFMIAMPIVVVTFMVGFALGLDSVFN